MVAWGGNTGPNVGYDTFLFLCQLAACMATAHRRKTSEPQRICPPALSRDALTRLYTENSVSHRPGAPHSSLRQGRFGRPGKCLEIRKWLSCCVPGGCGSLAVGGEASAVGTAALVVRRM